MFALPISMLRFKAFIFITIPKINLFLQKNAKFLVCWELRPQTFVPPAAGAFPPDPQPPVAVSFAPRPPKTAPKLRISGYAPGILIAIMLFCVN